MPEDTQALRALEAAAAAWGLGLPPGQLRLLRGYLEDLQAHNLRANLTAPQPARTLLLRHVADALACVPVLKELLAPKIAAPRILDLGSGGGLIGIPLKIAWPEAQVTLLEPAKKKFDFLNMAVLRSGLKGLRVLRQSAGGGCEGFDAVLERAVAPLPKALSLAWPLTASGGYVLAYQSQCPDPSQAPLQRALARLSARLLKSVPYRLPLEDRERYLAVFQK